MLDLKFIQEKYEEMSTTDLIKLSEKPKDLREDVIPILKSELIKRGKKDAAEQLTNPKANELNYQDMSYDEIRQMVNDRLKDGEPMDSIKADLKDNELDAFEILKEETQFKDKVFESITHLKESGANSIEINKHLEENYNIETTKAEKLKSDLKVRGKRNKNIGFVLIIGSVCLGLTVLVADHQLRLLKTSAAFFIAGFSMFMLGTKQEKEEASS